MHEAGVGRHVVASRDILPGEVLFTEAPLVSCQLDDHVEAVCEVTIITVIISVIIMIIRRSASATPRRPSPAPPAAMSTSAAWRAGPTRCRPSTSRSSLSSLDISYISYFTRYLSC